MWERILVFQLQMPIFLLFQKDLCEALHSYISGVRDQGCVPALHSVTHPQGGAPENAVLISQGGGAPGVPRVEWAHPDTELQAGDR